MNTQKPTGRITPLWIVAAFVTLTEAVLGYALTQVQGGVQTALTVFVISFALLVATSFFAILWNRPYVFYSPSEYQSIDPKQFVEALRPSIPLRVAEQITLAASVESNPADSDAQFRLIDGMLDEHFRQHLILMHEFDCALPYNDFPFGSHDYMIEYNRGSMEGGFQTRDFVRKLEGTGFISMSVNNGPCVTLTPSGHRFVVWLIDNGKKAPFMLTRFGSWGTARDARRVERFNSRADQPDLPPASPPSMPQSQSSN